jgi:hypothetical protein
MTDLDRETQAAIEALVYRLRNRADEDDEPFAQEYVTALRARGWRPTSARASWDYRNAHHGDGMPTSEESQREIDAARERLREIARRPQAGDAA